VLVDKDVVEAARHFRLADTGYFKDLVCIGQARDIQDVGAQIAVRALAELRRLHDIVAALMLEVLDVHAAEAGVQIRVFHAPADQDLWVGRVRDIDDIGTAFGVGSDRPTRNVGVRAGHLLLELDVHRVEDTAQRNMSFNGHVV